MDAIEKRKSENEVVWISLQARQLKCKNAIIPKLKGDRTDLMFIFYADPKRREKFFKPDTVKDEGKTTAYMPIVVMLPEILGSICF